MDKELTFSTGSPLSIQEYDMQRISLSSMNLHRLEQDSESQEKGGIVAAIFNFTNCIIGAGILGLPYALHIMGFYPGLILLFSVAYLTNWSISHLVYCGIKKQRLDYELIMEYCFGKCGFYLVTVLMFVNCYSVMIAYHIVIGDVMTPVVEFMYEKGFGGDGEPIYVQRWFIVTLCSAIFMLPLCLLKNIKTLSSTSGLSIIALFIIVVTFVWGADHDVEPVPDVHEQKADAPLQQSVIWTDFFQQVGVMLFAFCCNEFSFITYNSLRNANAKRWSKVSQSSVGIALAMSLVLSVTGYVWFNHTVQWDILNVFAYDTYISHQIQGEVSIPHSQAFTYPIEHFVARHCVMMLFASFSRQFNIHDMEQRNCRYFTCLYIVTLILWGSSLMIGANAQNLGFVMSLSGSVCASSLGYIFPALIVIQTNGLWVNRRHLWKTRLFITAFFTLGFGICALCAGTFTTIYMGDYVHN